MQKIRFVVEEQNEGSGFSVGSYLVPVERLPTFIKQLRSSDVVVSSELVQLTGE
jgi:hypothetical protein